MTKNRLRPAQLATILLAAEGGPPRQRARDQQPDRAGIRMKQQVLERLITLDPDANQFESALIQIVDEMGPPSGPTRAIAANVRDDWRAACDDPDLVKHLLGQAARVGRQPLT